MQYTCTAIFTAVKHDNFQLKIVFKFKVKLKEKNCQSIFRVSIFREYPKSAAGKRGSDGLALISYLILIRILCFWYQNLTFAMI